MPGFTSFLLGHGPFSAAVQESTPLHSDDEFEHSDDEFETEASKKRRLQLERKRACQVSRIYGTIMTRKDTEQTLDMLRHLRSDIDSQVETFHDIGVAAEKKRKQGISEFFKRNELVVRDVVAVLQRFEEAQGAVQDLFGGSMELSDGMVGRDQDQENGKVDVVAVENVVAIYQRRIRKPLDDVIKEVGKALGMREGWSDPK